MILIRLSPEASVGIAVYLLGLAAVGLALFGHKASVPWSWTAEMLVLIGSAVLAVGAAAFLLTRAWRSTGRRRTGGFHAPLILHSLMLSLAFLAIEVGLRLMARPDPMGTRIGDLVLVPYDWDHVAERSRSQLQSSRAPGGFYVEDRDLGWTVAPSRRSRDGLYATSVEGARSREPGDALFDSPVRRRVLITGDSFAFSEEVPFEASVTRHLERELGAGTQVVTIGVPGYGIDQAVLRAERDGVQWKADVTVLQFVQDDIHRIGSIYLFNKPWWESPFVKPRFIARDGRLQQLPLPTLDDVYRYRSVFDLPHLPLDIYFEPEHWRRRAAHASWLYRFLASRFPNYPPSQADPGASPEHLAVLLIERFVASVRKSGGIPLIVYFPGYGDFIGQDRGPKERVLEELARRGVQALDPTECMGAFGDYAALIVRGGVHYSDAGNARMAACLRPTLRALLGEQ